ncbi:sigma-70 family RNA polymerase sigma factor [Actinokineospora sp. 24-640]
MTVSVEDPEHAVGWASGDALLRALYRDHWIALLRFVRGLTGDWSGAEDIAQETLLRAWRHRGTLRAESSAVRGWLLTVARHLVIDRVRARAARPTEVADTALPQGRTGTDRWDEITTALTMADLLHQLTPDKRDVVVEIFYRGSTIAEAAARLGLPKGTVKSRAHRALHDLRALVSPALRAC